MDGKLSLLVERPVAGGRMLARHDGRVVLVSGAVPGERVLARVERVSRKVVFAATVDVIEASPDRRPRAGDPACGGLSYAHITPDRQRQLKAEVIRDAFRRIGRLTVDDIAVAPSPEEGYRLRGRLHVQRGRAGLYVERTHRLCDPAESGQFRQDALDAVAHLLRVMGRSADRLEAIVIAENVAATERAVHLEPRTGEDGRDLVVENLAIDGLTGVTTTSRGRLACVAGRGRVADTAADLCGAGHPWPDTLAWTRSPASFFQGNRFVTGAMLLRVTAAVQGARVLDLYAGVGLFSLGLAAAGVRVTAVESDDASAADLEINADQVRETLTPRQTTVEAAVLTTSPGSFDTVVLDPPRTGASPEAMAGIAALQAERIVYVSCDPATLARDSAVLAGAGYRLSHVEAFDLFPNTAHIETLAVFDRTAA